MTIQQRKYIADITRAIDLIELFVNDITIFTDYVQDLKTQSAVERQLVII